MTDGRATNRTAVPVLIYYRYMGRNDDRGGNRVYFCSECRSELRDCYGWPETPEDLEKRNQSDHGLGDWHRWDREPLRYIAFCPWCGVEFEEDWDDGPIQNERAIDHFSNPGTHKGDQHIFEGSDPNCMMGHWLGTSGGDKVCWCDPVIEADIMGCTIRHRNVPRPAPAPLGDWDDDD